MRLPASQPASQAPARPPARVSDSLLFCPLTRSLASSGGAMHDCDVDVDADVEQADKAGRLTYVSQQ